MASPVNESIYRSLNSLVELADDLIAATAGCQDDTQQVLRAFSQVALDGIRDVLVLARSNRGTGAIKVARSMLELSLTGEYLERHPAESVDYVDFAYVLVWRWAQSNPGKLNNAEMQQTAREYSRVKPRFTNRKGGLRNSWSAKSVKDIADQIGRTEIYEVIYRTASMLNHVDVLGLLGHELDWTPEALRVAHGSLLQTVCCLYNVSDLDAFADRMGQASKEFTVRWKEYASAR